MQMVRAGISILRIDNVLISHLHGDHIFGLFGLLSTMSMMGRAADLHIYAPDGIQKIIDFHNSNFGALHFKVCLHIVSCKRPVVIVDRFKSFAISAFPLHHRIETYGYMFKERMPERNIIKSMIDANHLSYEEMATLKRGEDVIRSNGDKLSFDKLTYQPRLPRSFAYCCDTAPFKELPLWIKGADIIYHESTYGDDLAELAKTTFHSTAADAARCAKEAGAEMLVIGHYSSRYKSLKFLLEQARAIFPNTFLSEELKKYSVPEKNLPEPQ